MTIGETLRQARKAVGLTQKQIADMLGVSRQFANDLERDRRAFAEKYLPDLPPAVRGPVAEALMNQHHEAISRLSGAAQ